METSNIRGLLGQGKTGEALEALLVRTRQDPRYKNNLTRTLEVLQAGFERVRQQELKGILSFQEAQREYSKTADAILAILDDVEAGRVPAVVFERRRKWVLLGFAVLILVAFGVWRLWSEKTYACPDFEQEKALHILVLPFKSLDERQAAVELRIQEDISKLTRKADLSAEVRLGSKTDSNETSLEFAERHGKACHADLVIFGQYKAFDQDSIRTNLGYSFLNDGGQSGDFPFETFRDITEVGTPRDLQDALFSVCAMVAMREKNWEYARRWMDKIKVKDGAEKKIAVWLAEK